MNVQNHFSKCYKKFANCKLFILQNFNRSIARFRNAIQLASMYAEVSRYHCFSNTPGMITYFRLDLTPFTQKTQSYVQTEKNPQKLKKIYRKRMRYIEIKKDSL